MTKRILWTWPHGLSLAPSLAVAISCISGVVGCGGATVIGEAGTGGAAASGGAAQTGSGDPPNCTGSDFGHEQLAQYESWSQMGNDLGALVGTQWTGRILGGPDLALTIAADGSGDLQVGGPSEIMDKDKGYLCDETTGCIPPSDGDPIREGGTYPLHDATFGSGRLHFELDPGSAYDAWCRAQTPILNDPVSCIYALVPNDTIGWGPTCSVGQKVVDCGWFELAIWNGTTCNCTAETCFPVSFKVSFDADYDAEKSKFTGVIGDQDFLLTRVQDSGCGVGDAGSAGSCGN